MALKKLLQLFCVGKKDSKKKGKPIDPLWQASASRSSVNVTANKTHLDPCSSGNDTVSVQNHEVESSSTVSSWARTEHGTEITHHSPFSQFDVVQDFSDHHYAKTSAGKVTKDWVKAIQSEWDLLQKNLPESIYVRVYEDRTDLLRAAIVGPAGTPYHDGLFFFDVRFPCEYPKCPPKVYYHSGGLRLNPNLYESGKVCLSLLNTWWGKGCEKWGKSSSSMLQVLVSIQGLVLNDRPYFNEPGSKNSAETTGGERCSLAYNQTAFVRSCKTMLYSLRKPPMHFETLVLWHFHEHERAILDACRAYMSGTVVGSSAGTGSNRRYVHDKCFAEFHKSLTLYTEHLRAEFAANTRRVMELETEDEIVPSIAASVKSC